MNENTVVSLTLDINEVKAIISVLGELPTKSNAFPLMAKVINQAEAQMPKQEAAQAE